MERLLQKGDRFRFKEPQAGVLTLGTHPRAYAVPAPFWTSFYSGRPGWCHDEISIPADRELIVIEADRAIDGTQLVQASVTLTRDDFIAQKGEAVKFTDASALTQRVVFRQKVENGSCWLGEEVPVEVVIVS